MGTYGVQIKGVLPWLARFVGLVGPVQEIFYPALAALVSLILYIIFFPRRKFKFRPATCNAPLTLNNYIQCILKYYLAKNPGFCIPAKYFVLNPGKFLYLVIKGHHPRKTIKPFTFHSSEGSVQTSLTQNCLQLTIPAFLLTSFLFLVAT
jgi:hypothetical protein